MNILYIPLEFERYYSAKKMTYPVGVGLVEGFVDKVDFTVVPTFYGSGMWLEYLQQITMGQKYDQVFLEVVHSNMNPAILDFISSLAPVRVGFVIESLTIHSDEYENNLQGTKNREDNLAMKLPYLTHLVVVDERDVNYAKIPTTFEVASVPESMIDVNLNKKANISDKVIFYGTLYGERAKWVNVLGERALINPQEGLEEKGGIPQQYESVVRSAFDNMNGKETIPIGYYKRFCDDWMRIRKIMYSNWMNILWEIEGYGVLNPPHRTSVLSSRVIESMAAGKVIYSPRMFNGADFLFTNGKNILYYESIEELVDLINSISQEDKYNIAQNAINIILEKYTTEKMIGRVLKFIEENP
jgi:hypothetical protein